MFRKRIRGTEFVVLSIGKIYLFDITNGILNKATNKSSYKNTIISNNLFLMETERLLTGLSKRNIASLSLKDGRILRSKIISILTDNEIIIVNKPVETDTANIFSNVDEQWFDKAKNAGLSKIGGLPNASR